MNRLKSVYEKFRYPIVLVYFLIMTILMTYPLILHLGRSILGGLGDGVYFVWLIRWYQGVIFEGWGAPFFNAQMNYPQGWNLSTTDTALATALPGVPFSLLFGPIAGYNIAMGLTFILSGFFMYLWVRRQTASDSAGLIAGTLFAFLPYRMAHFMAGHLNLSGTAWFPLYFLAIQEIFTPKEKTRWWPPLLGGVALGLIGLSSMYYLYFTLLVSVLFLAGYLLFSKRGFLRNKNFWQELILLPVFSAPFLFVALRPFLQLAGSGGLADRPLEYANRYSASPTDFFTISADHFALGQWISSILDRSLWMESSLYIGLVTLLLIAFYWYSRKGDRQLSFAKTALFIMLVCFILALGPSLHWNNQQLLIPNAAGEALPITLPATWLFTYLPFFSKMRAVMRIGLFVLLFGSALAGLGSAKLLNRWNGWRRILVLSVILLLILLDFYPGPYTQSVTPLQARAVDTWLAEQPGDGAVVQMPFGSSTDQIQLYYTLTHQKPFTGGFFNANQPPQFQYLQGILARFPDEKSVQTLVEYQVEYVLLEPDDYADYSSVEAAIIELGLERLTEIDGVVVFHLEPDNGTQP
jgi:hypothetical protein